MKFLLGFILIIIIVIFIIGLVISLQNGDAVPWFVTGSVLFILLIVLGWITG